MPPRETRNGPPGSTHNAARPPDDSVTAMAQEVARSSPGCSGPGLSEAAGEHARRAVAQALPLPPAERLHQIICGALPLTIEHRRELAGLTPAGDTP
jgi:hypothetical protein